MKKKIMKRLCIGRNGARINLRIKIKLIMHQNEIKQIDVMEG